MVADFSNKAKRQLIPRVLGICALVGAYVAADAVILSATTTPAEAWSGGRGGGRGWGGRGGGGGWAGRAAWGPGWGARGGGWNSGGWGGRGWGGGGWGYRRGWNGGGWGYRRGWGGGGYGWGGGGGGPDYGWGAGVCPCWNGGTWVNRCW